MSRRRRSYRIAPAPGSALPNQAGDESSDNIASTGQISRGGRKAPFYCLAFVRERCKLRDSRPIQSVLDDFRRVGMYQHFGAWIVRMDGLFYFYAVGMGLRQAHLPWQFQM